MCLKQSSELETYFCPENKISFPFIEKSDYLTSSNSRVNQHENDIYVHHIIGKSKERRSKNDI